MKIKTDRNKKRKEKASRLIEKREEQAIKSAT